MRRKPAATREFVINPYLAVRLEGRKTVIYVGGKRFQQCKALMIIISSGDYGNLAEFDSIDEFYEKFTQTSIDSLSKIFRLQSRMDSIVADLKNFNQSPWIYKGNTSKISPETEFWGHCSNLQAWADYNYDTRLLYHNLAFPLLKALADAGDPKARNVLGQEVAARLASGHDSVVGYLMLERYYRYLMPSNLTDLPLKVLYALAETGEFDLNLEVFSPVREKCPMISINGRPSAIIWNSMLNLSNRGLRDKFQLEEILHQVKHPHELTNLNLGDNLLQSLPSSIGDFQSLRTLLLSSNKLFSLPESLGNLRSVHELILRKNLLKSLPVSIGNINSLEILDLSYNNLATIPESLAHLSSLQILDLRQNQLLSLPESFSHLSTLHILNLTGNKRLKLSPLLRQWIDQLKQHECTVHL